MLADGSTVIAVTATMLDEQGNVKRLNNQLVRFVVEGEGRLINNPGILENPVKIVWGTAVALIKTNLKAGTIRVIAMPAFTGTNTIKGDTLVINTIPPAMPSVYSPKDVNHLETYSSPIVLYATDANRIDPISKKEELKKVEEGQKKFQTNRND